MTINVAYQLHILQLLKKIKYRHMLYKHLMRFSTLVLCIIQIIRKNFHNVFDKIDTKHLRLLHYHYIVIEIQTQKVTGVHIISIYGYNIKGT